MRLLCLLLLCSTAWAGTVRLVNDTSYKLRAVIRAADGTELGSLDVPSQQTMSWNSYWGGVGNIQYNNISQTPYTVLWYCSDGNPFSVCTGVSTGSTVTASSCDGTKSCKQPNKKSGRTYPPEIPETQIQHQTEQDAGPPQGMVE
jgi:hypothetical protein